MHRQTHPAATGRRLDSDTGLLDAACAVALHVEPRAGDAPARASAQVAKLASQVRKDWARVSGGRDAASFKRRASESPQMVMAYLHRRLFDEAGFHGNSGDYYDPGNSLLPGVLEKRRGLPIALAMVYKLVAGRLGLKCWGVGMPGHFVAGVECHGPVLVDCFDGGRLLNRTDAADRVAACCGPEAGFSDDMLRPVTHRHWITRLIQNLLQTYTASGRHADVAAMLELEILLWPDQLHLRRDLGLVLARLGQTRPAAGWLADYLRERPDDPQRAELEELLGVMS
jgi:regulator of sirC expression with transglutaminase-like and TPR domain